MTESFAPLCVQPCEPDEASGGVGGGHPHTTSKATFRTRSSDLRYTPVVSSGRRNTLISDARDGMDGRWVENMFEGSMRWPRRSCGTAGGAHSQFNRVA